MTQRSNRWYFYLFAFWQTIKVFRLNLILMIHIYPRRSEVFLSLNYYLPSKWYMALQVPMTGEVIKSIIKWILIDVTCHSFIVYTTIRTLFGNSTASNLHEISIYCNMTVPKFCLNRLVNLCTVNVSHTSKHFILVPQGWKLTDVED